jgi:hypothetical protein
MDNIKSYERFNDSMEENYNGIGEGMGCQSCLSEKAKMGMKDLCESILMREADEYDRDVNVDHTYEGYITECMKYMNEMLGRPGYSTISKPYTD